MNCKLLDHSDRDLWYKLKHRILPTKDKLFKMNIVTDDKCPLCNTETENLEHIFIYCQKHLEAWIFIEHILSKYTGNKHYYMTDTNRILGNGMDNLTLCLIGKLLHTIWSIRCDILNKTADCVAFGI